MDQAAQQVAQHASGLTFIDILVIATLVLSAGLALTRGIVRELMSLSAWVGAALAAYYLFPFVKPWMHTHVKGAATANIATGLAVFCVALAILIPLGIFFSSLVRGRALTAIDRSLGFVYGLARGVLVICLLYMLTMSVWPDPEKGPESLRDSKTRPLMAYGAQVLRSYLPEDTVSKASEALREHDEAIGASIDDQILDHTSSAVKDAPRSDSQVPPPPPPLPPSPPASQAVPAQPVNVPLAPTTSTPGYDQNSRNGMNSLINQQGAPPGKPQ